MLEATSGEEKAGHLWCWLMVSVSVTVIDGLVPLQGFRFPCRFFPMHLVCG